MLRNNVFALFMWEILVFDNIKWFYTTYTSSHNISDLYRTEKGHSKKNKGGGESEEVPFFVSAKQKYFISYLFHQMKMFPASV